MKASFSKCLLRTFFIWVRLTEFIWVHKLILFKEGERESFLSSPDLYPSPWACRNQAVHNGSELRTSAAVRLSCSHGGVADAGRNRRLPSSTWPHSWSILPLLQEASPFPPGPSSGCHESTSTSPWTARFFSFPCVPFPRCSTLKSSSSCSSLFGTQESGVLLSVRCVVRRRRHWIGRRWRPQAGWAIMGLRGFCGQVKTIIYFQKYTEVKLST